MKITVVAKKEWPGIKELRKRFKVAKDGDICIAAGGDGTFIRAARMFDGPILPVRSGEEGSIGYYADIGMDGLGQAMDLLERGEYSIEKLANKIEIEVHGRKYYAVNEAVLNNALEEVSFRVYEVKKGQREEIYPYVMSGDGILITSVVGSTAYNKSAGGPIILSPSVFCITFINVDGPYRSPIVVGSEKEIEIEIVKYKGKLRYDGIELGTLSAGERFRVRLSEKELNIIRFKGMREGFGKKLERIISSRMKK